MTKEHYDCRFTRSAYRQVLGGTRGLRKVRRHFPPLPSIPLINAIDPVGELLGSMFAPRFEISGASK